MPNRTTVKNNIQVLNVPTVSNADLNQMLQTNICDNTVFKEDVAVTQSSSVTAITCDFTGRDRIDLTRTGGALQITVSGIVDGDRVFLLITKTAGQAVTFVGVTDITPVAANVTAVTTVLYEIIRKGSNYFASAIIKSPLYATTAVEGIVKLATSAQGNALTDLTVAVTPGTIPKGSTIQEGIVEIATPAEVDAGTDVDGTGDQLVVEPSQLIRKLNEFAAAPTWQTITLSAGWTGTLRYFKDLSNIVYLHGANIERTGANITGIAGQILATLPAGVVPDFSLPIAVAKSQGGVQNYIFGQITLGGVYMYPNPLDIITGAVVDFYIAYKD